MKHLDFIPHYDGPSNLSWPSAPSAVERLAALSDPEIADKILLHDNPSLWAAKMLEDVSEQLATVRQVRNALLFHSKSSAEHPESGVKTSTSWSSSPCTPTTP